MIFDCRDKLAIAPYGFEKSTWDPSTDYFLPENFNAENMNGKAVCKVALLQRLGLTEHSSTILVSGPPLCHSSLNNVVHPFRTASLNYNFYHQYYIIYMILQIFLDDFLLRLSVHYLNFIRLDAIFQKELILMSKR
jgi:hypothetical protein